MPRGHAHRLRGASPNAGKSTIVNALLEAEARVIVDRRTPGTTRDAVYLPFRHREQDVVLIDTAGLRRRKQVSRAQEKLAAIKSIRAMERTEIVVLVIDATQGVTDQDQRIARMAFTRGKGVVVMLHKWDRIAGDKRRAHEVRTQAEEGLAFLERPLMIRSSVTGDGRDTGQGRGRGLGEALDACLDLPDLTPPTGRPRHDRTIGRLSISRTSPNHTAVAIRSPPLGPSSPAPAFAPTWWSSATDRSVVASKTVVYSCRARGSRARTSRTRSASSPAVAPSFCAASSAASNATGTQAAASRSSGLSRTLRLDRARPSCSRAIGWPRSRRPCRGRRPCAG